MANLGASYDKMFAGIICHLFYLHSLTKILDLIKRRVLRYRMEL